MDDFNKRVQTLIDLAAEGKITSDVLAASLNALYEARKLNPLSEEEKSKEPELSEEEKKKQQVIEASRKRAAENRENVEYIKQSEKYRSNESSKTAEEMKVYLRTIYTADGVRLFSDKILDEMGYEELINTGYGVENVETERRNYLRKLVDAKRTRIIPEYILAKMDYEELEREYRKYNSKAAEYKRMTVNDGYEKKDHTELTEEQWGTYLKTLPGYTPGGSGTGSSGDDMAEKIKKAEEDAKAAADERERQEQAARDAAKAAGAGSNGTVVPIPNDPGTNPDPTKTTGPTTGTNGTTGTGNGTGDEPKKKEDSEEITPEEIEDTYNKQAGSKNRRKIKNRKKDFTEKEAKDYGEEVEKLGKKRAFRKYFAKILIAIVAFWLIALVPPVASIVAWKFLNDYVKDCSEDKHKGTIGQWIKKMINAEDFKEKLDEKIKEANKETVNQEDSSKEKSQTSKEEPNGKVK